MNPFAYEMSTRYRSTFHSEFEEVSKSVKAQDFLWVTHCAICKTHIKRIRCWASTTDIVSRGGCVLLGADFIDKNGHQLQ